jgi:hypothetical protein
MRSPVEITGGVLRIGKEMNVFQEYLKENYFSSFFLGVCMFSTFYSILGYLVRSMLLAQTSSRGKRSGANNNNNTTTTNNNNSSAHYPYDSPSEPWPAGTERQGDTAASVSGTSPPPSRREPSDSRAGNQQEESDTPEGDSAQPSYETSTRPPFGSDDDDDRWSDHHDSWEDIND